MTATASPDIKTALQEIQKLLTTHSERDLLILKTAPIRRATSRVRPLFSSLVPFLTPEVISYLGANPDGEINLSLLGKKVDGHFHFYHHIFKHRHLLPQEEIFKLWFKYLYGFSFLLSSQSIEIVEQEKIISIRETPADLELLAALPLTDPLLVDHPVVSFRTVQVRKPGWQYLRYRHKPTREVSGKLNGKLWESLEKDHLETFLIYLDMTGSSVDYAMVMKMFQAGAWKIFRALLAEKRLFETGLPPEETVTPEELCCCCVAVLNDAEAVEVLELLEKNFPGVIKNTKDDLGRNLFWYTFDQASRFNPRNRLIQFLLEKGADPGNTNTLGLSWQYICDSMTEEMREKAQKWPPTFEV